MRFRKKPVVIDAEQYRRDGDNPFGVVCLARCNGRERFGEAHIHTLEGEHIVSKGDWIITGVKGEHYPCKPDIFDATYEPVDVQKPPDPLTD